MSRYFPSRSYLWTGLAASASALFAGWIAIGWRPALFAAIPMIGISAFALLLATRPRIELRSEYLVIGRRAIRWADIRRVDRLRWRSPLLVRLTLSGGRRLLLLYPGDLDSANSLLRHIRRSSRLALIEGRPYREFWGEALPAAPARRQLDAPRYRLLLPEDEAEIERLYQQLKAARRSGAQSSADES
jgi:hypothetical protein